MIFSGSQLESNKKAMTIQVFLNFSYIWYVKILVGNCDEFALLCASVTIEIEICWSIILREGNMIRNRVSGNLRLVSANIVS